MLLGLIACGAVACIALGIAEAGARLTRHAQHQLLLFGTKALELALIVGILLIIRAFGDTATFYSGIVGAFLGALVLPYFLS